MKTSRWLPEEVDFVDVSPAEWKAARERIEKETGDSRSLFVRLERIMEMPRGRGKGAHPPGGGDTKS